MEKECGVGNVFHCQDYEAKTVDLNEEKIMTLIITMTLTEYVVDYVV